MKWGVQLTVMHMLRKPMVYYDKIYLYTPNEHQGKIQDLRNIMQKISQKVGYNVERYLMLLI